LQQGITPKAKPLAHKNRLNKNAGFVYLLKSLTEADVYKFGCTRYAPEDRCKAINKCTPFHEFEVLTSFRSKQIFHDECRIKWLVWDYADGVHGELFKMEEGIEEILDHYKQKAES
jgi:hypothetical protein